MDKQYKTTREFPLSEYKSRYDKARNLMRKQNIDALLLTQRENVEYFSGFLTHLWDSKYRPICTILPMDGDPALVVPLLLKITAERTSWIKDVRAWRDPSGLADRTDCAEMIIHTIKDMGLAGSTFGIESGYDMRIGLPLRDMDYIKSNLEKCAFKDAYETVWQCRMFKSQLERERIKKATDITCKSMKETFETTKPGDTERDIHRMMSMGFLKYGADEVGFCNVKVSNDPWRCQMADSFPCDNKIKKGDMIMADVGAKYGGYYADMTRMAFVGEPPQKYAKSYEAARAATEAAIAVTGPGVKVCNVYNAAVESLNTAHEIRLPGDRIGHAVGLDIHEPPTIGSEVKEELKPGMIITLEPIISSPTGAMFIEDVICITEKGFENYSYLSKELFIVH
jgi:Xaa-Pro aminopeptidase